MCGTAAFSRAARVCAPNPWGHKHGHSLTSGLLGRLPRGAGAEEGGAGGDEEGAGEEEEEQQPA